MFCLFFVIFLVVYVFFVCSYCHLAQYVFCVYKKNTIIRILQPLVSGL